jgi:hypothetical protein
MNTTKTLPRYKAQDAFAATFLSALMASAWGHFYNAAIKNDPVNGIKGSATFPVGYLFDNSAAESIKLVVEVELSGNHFPFEGGAHRQPDLQLTHKALNLLNLKGPQPLSEQAEVFEMDELLAVGKGRYSVKIKVTTYLKYEDVFKSQC